MPLIFCVDIDEKIIEIKSSSVTDKNNLIKYFRDNFVDCNPTKIKTTVFEKYEPEEVLRAFTRGISPKKDEVNDFIVNKISFRESPITNSPKVTIELENEDIWPSVIYAHNNNCINLESLKDIEGLTIKSDGKSRSVRSIISENGNVLFVMDDSRLDEKSKITIIENFKKKFGIPLNQEIANSKFVAGKADKVDYIMGTRKEDNLDSDGIEIFKELKEKSFLVSSEKENFYCNTCNLEKEITDDFDIQEGCPECGNKHLKIKKINENKLNIRQIKSFVRKTLGELDDWTISKGESNLVLDESEHYKFFNLKHNEQDEILQVLITDQSLPIGVLM
ncbi:hypothetical protein H5P36_24510 [Bacillus sp. APMAM]|nr:hypothetical protein [Bacillus sp. APMAM]RTZ53274.1 hypothetical protein EKO25_24250 [Bacillus sp. SAJ1]